MTDRLLNNDKLQGMIVLPEVVELEVRTKILRQVVIDRGTVLQGLQSIRMIVGETQEVTLPSDDEFREAIAKRFSILEEFIQAPSRGC